MINAVNEIVNVKTTNQYMIIEDNYLTLRRYLQLLINASKKNNCSTIDLETVELILKALSDEPIETSDVVEVVNEE